ncbi:hypothetical protein, partial [Rathayibacter sp. VKM Ac-2630]|uniref:hypothetical protein n=1 Tax=Rathayibacter sp. VKM Ac-2630 TaxID=1938617 RepID=UPI0009CD3D01
MSPDSPSPAASASTLGESTPPLSRRELRERERAQALAAEVAAETGTPAPVATDLLEAERRVAQARVA